MARTHVLDTIWINRIRTLSMDAVLAAKALPLREVLAEPNYHPRQSVDAASSKQPQHQPEAQGMDQTIMHQIVQRTSARIKGLEVEIVENVIIIRGCAPCYYVKQLAIQGVLDALGPSRTCRVELNVYVPEATLSVVDS